MKTRSKTKAALAVSILFSGFAATESSAGFASKDYLPLIPIVEFADSPLADAIAYLEVRSVELDTKEHEPDRRVIKFFFDRDNLNPHDVNETVTLKREMVNFEEVLAEVCEQTGTAYVDFGSAVVITSIAKAAELIPANYLRRSSGRIGTTLAQANRLTSQRSQAQSRRELIIFSDSHPYSPT